jgi:GAF domain-containing protein
MSSRPAPYPRPRGPGIDRLQRLLDAQRAVTDDLALDSVLDRVVRAACDLVGARYAALAVFADDGSVEQVVQRGFEAATTDRFGGLPAVLFDRIFDVDGVVRIDDLGADPYTAEIPRRQPIVRSVVGVPIRVRGASFAELYLTDPVAGRFGADDEELLVALSATAGTAIENARLYDEARRSRDWLNASGEIARALLSDADESVLLEVVSRALRVAEADYAALILPTEDARLRVTVAKGLGADVFRDLVFDPNESVLGKAILAAESIRTHDLMLWVPVDFDNRLDLGPAMIAPLVDAQGCRGAVLLIRTAQRVPFNPHDVDLASTFAAQVAVALELSDARADAEWLRVLEDRHRIAEDLHDNVMQRLFATGMGLQALAQQRLEPDVAERLRRYISDLDETIDEIRGRVFGLRDDTVTGLRRQRTRFPRVARRAASAAFEAGTAALRTFTPPGFRRDERPGRAG